MPDEDEVTQEETQEEETQAEETEKSQVQEEEASQEEQKQEFDPTTIPDDVLASEYQRRAQNYAPQKQEEERQPGEDPRWEEVQRLHDEFEHVKASRLAAEIARDEARQEMVQAFQAQTQAQQVTDKLIAESTLPPEAKALFAERLKTINPFEVANKPEIKQSLEDMAYGQAMREGKIAKKPPTAPQTSEVAPRPHMPRSKEHEKAKTLIEQAFGRFGVKADEILEGEQI